MIRESTAFLSFADDIKNRSFLDWVEAHTSLMNPLHRYKGLLILDRETLSFVGTERKTGIEFQFVIYRHEIQQLYHGFDGVFNAFETRSLGLTWRPLRITFIREKIQYHIYLIVNYSFGRSDNEVWMEMLKEWLEADQG